MQLVVALLFSVEMVLFFLIVLKLFKNFERILSTADFHTVDKFYQWYLKT